MMVRTADWIPTLEDPEIQRYLFEEVGEEGQEMAQFLLDNEPISSVDILDHYAERKPSDVRKVLYRLMEAHAAEYEKDTDKAGWETFTWRLDLPEVALILRRRWADELVHLQKQLRFEQDHEYYACDDLHRRMVFEDAIDIDFHCPVCQKPMEPVDNAPVIEAIRGRVQELQPFITA